MVKSGLDSDEEEKFKPHALNVLQVCDYAIYSIQNEGVLSTTR